MTVLNSCSVVPSASHLIPCTVAGFLMEINSLLKPCSATFGACATIFPLRLASISMENPFPLQPPSSSLPPLGHIDCGGAVFTVVLTSSGFWPHLKLWQPSKSSDRANTPAPGSHILGCYLYASKAVHSEYPRLCRYRSIHSPGTEQARSARE